MPLRLIAEILTVVLVGLLAFFLAFPIYAGTPCSTATISGPWRLFASGPAQDLPSDPIFAHVEYDCRAAWTRNGTLRRFRCTSPTSPIQGAAFPEVVQWSTVAVGKSCWVRIHIGDRLTGLQLTGQFTPDRQMVVGQGFTYDEPTQLMFQMVRLR